MTAPMTTVTFLGLLILRRIVLLWLWKRSNHHQERKIRALKRPDLLVPPQWRALLRVRLRCIHIKTMVLFRSTTLMQLQQFAVKQYSSRFQFWLHHTFYFLRFDDLFRHDHTTWSVQSGRSYRKSRASRIRRWKMGYGYLFTERDLKQHQNWWKMRRIEPAWSIRGSLFIRRPRDVSCQCIFARWEGHSLFCADAWLCLWFFSSLYFWAIFPVSCMSFSPGCSAFSELADSTPFFVHRLVY